MPLGTVPSSPRTVRMRPDDAAPQNARYPAEVFDDLDDLANLAHL